jgi:hypothetical protein
MARVGLADRIRREGTDGCDRDVVSFGLGEGHCRGRKVRVQSKADVGMKILI